MNTSRNSNIYGFEAARALAACEGFVEGTPNCTLAILAERELPEDARTALASSAERLGYGRDGVFWIVRERADGTALDAPTLQKLLIACDPLAFVAADAAAAAFLEEAFDTSCPLDAAGQLQGRTVVAFDSFPAMLTSPEKKQQAWALLKKLA